MIKKCFIAITVIVISFMMYFCGYVQGRRAERGEAVKMIKNSLDNSLNARINIPSDYYEEFGKLPQYDVLAVCFPYDTLQGIREYSQ